MSEATPRVIRHMWPDGKQFIAHAEDVTCDRCSPSEPLCKCGHEADATTDLEKESEIAALLGRTFTYSDPSIYVDYDVPGDTFRIGDVRFSTKALAAVLIAYMADAEQRGREDNADHGMCYVHGSKAVAGKLADAWDEGRNAGVTDMTRVIGWGAGGCKEDQKPNETPNPYRTPESEDTE